MKVLEVFNTLLINPNPIIVRHNRQGKNTVSQRNSSQLPIYSGSKGGRYWFNCGLVSDLEIVALFGLAVIIEQKPVVIDIPLSVILEEEKETQQAVMTAIIDFNLQGELILPIMDLEVAKQIYENRSNGYCNFKTSILIDEKICVELGSELCLDELLAIYSLLQDKKKVLQNGDKDN